MVKQFCGACPAHIQAAARIPSLILVDKTVGILGRSQENSAFRAVFKVFLAVRFRCSEVLGPDPGAYV